MTVGGGLGVDCLTQTKLVNNRSRPQAEHLFHDFAELLVSVLAGAEAVDRYRDGVGFADGIRKSDLALLGETAPNEILCDIPCHIRAAAVNLYIWVEK